MEQTPSSLQGGVVAFNPKSAYGILFVTLTAAMTVPPFLPAGFLRHYVVPGFVTLALLSALATVASEKRTFRIGLGLAIPAFATAWIAAVLGSVAVQTASEVLTIGFFVHLGAAILKDVFTKPSVDSESIYAALSVFMFMAYAFALVYSIIDMHAPGSFDIPETMAMYQEQDPTTGQGIFGYFSITTLTTLGYGDISPISPAARSAAMLQAVLGQLYLVAIVARLVGLHVADRGHE